MYHVHGDLAKVLTFSTKNCKYLKAAGNPASVRDANAAAHNAQRQQAQQNLGSQAPPIATQVSTMYILVKI